MNESNYSPILKSPMAALYFHKEERVAIDMTTRSRLHWVTICIFALLFLTSCCLFIAK